jgi:hypothetical protein
MEAGMEGGMLVAVAARCVAFVQVPCGWQGVGGVAGTVGLGCLLHFWCWRWQPKALMLLSKVASGLMAISGSAKLMVQVGAGTEAAILRGDTAAGIGVGSATLRAGAGGRTGTGGSGWRGSTIGGMGLACTLKDWAAGGAAGGGRTGYTGAARLVSRVVSWWWSMATWLSASDWCNG